MKLKNGVYRVVCKERQGYEFIGWVKSKNNPTAGYNFEVITQITGELFGRGYSAAVTSNSKYSFELLDKNEFPEYYL